MFTKLFSAVLQLYEVHDCGHNLRSVHHKTFKTQVQHNKQFIYLINFTDFKVCEELNCIPLLKSEFIFTLSEEN